MITEFQLLKPIKILLTITNQTVILISLIITLQLKDSDIIDDYGEDSNSQG